MASDHLDPEPHGWQDINLAGISQGYQTHPTTARQRGSQVKVGFGSSSAVLGTSRVESALPLAPDMRIVLWHFAFVAEANLDQTITSKAADTCARAELLFPWFPDAAGTREHS